MARWVKRNYGVLDQEGSKKNHGALGQEKLLRAGSRGTVYRGAERNCSARGLGGTVDRGIKRN